MNSHEKWPVNVEQTYLLNYNAKILEVLAENRKDFYDCA